MQHTPWRKTASNCWEVSEGAVCMGGVRVFCRCLVGVLCMGGVERRVRRLGAWCVLGVCQGQGGGLDGGHDGRERVVRNAYASSTEPTHAVSFPSPPDSLPQPSLPHKHTHSHAA